MSTGRSGAGTSKSKADDIELLLKRIEEQNEQITRLQTKFRGTTSFKLDSKESNKKLF